MHLIVFRSFFLYSQVTPENQPSLLLYIIIDTSDYIKSVQLFFYKISFYTSIQISFENS